MALVWAAVKLRAAASDLLMVRLIAPVKEREAVKFLPNCFENAALKERVAVMALWNDLETARAPTNESAALSVRVVRLVMDPAKERTAVNPVLRVVRVRTAVSERVAEKDFAVALTSAPEKESVAVKLERMIFFVRSAEVESDAVKDWVNRWPPEMSEVARLPMNERPAEKDLETDRVSAPAKESAAVNAVLTYRLVRDPAKESEAVSDLVVCLERAPAKDKVAVNARLKNLLAARLPTKESVGVNALLVTRFVVPPTKERPALKPELTYFLVCALTNESDGVNTLYVRVGPNAPANERVAAKDRVLNFPLTNAPTNESAAVKLVLTYFLVRAAVSLKVALKVLKVLVGPNAPVKESVAVKDS